MMGSIDEWNEEIFEDLYKQFDVDGSGGIDR